MIEFLDTGLRPAPILTVAFTGISHALGGLHFDFGKSLSGVESATLLGKVCKSPGVDVRVDYPGR